MRADCVDAVSQALGRSVTAAEMRGIEERVTRAIKRMSIRDQEGFMRMTRDERYQEAGRLAAEDLAHDAGKRRARAELASRAHERNAAGLVRARATGKTMFEGLGHALRLADINAQGLARDYTSRLMDTWQATVPKVLGLIEDAAGVRRLVHEMFGEDTGSAIAKQGAKVWLEVTETLRQRANAAGFDIRRRADWHRPTAHDTGAILRADADRFASDVLPLLDRRQYVRGDGRRMSDAEVIEALKSMKATLGTEGLIDLEPAGFKQEPMLARRHEQPRELHFRDAEAWLEYHAKYGKGSFFSAMTGHIAGLSREIALAEAFGPHAEAEFRALHDMAKQDAAVHGGSDMLGPFLVSTDHMWKTLSGFTGRVYNGDQLGYRRLADFMQGVRNIETMGKLQSAFVSSVTDIGTFMATVHYNRLPALTTAANLIRSFGGEATEYANRAGLVADSLVSDLNRWSGEKLGQGFTGRLANATMKASLLNWWTDSIKRAFSVTMMGAMGKVSRSEWGALAEGDRTHFASKGITETDWKVYRLAAPEDWKGQRMLTPEAVRAVPADRLRAFGDPMVVREQAISRLLGAITDEADYASVTPDLYTRATVQRGTQRGSLEGEALRSIALFKSFPIAMISRHWSRALHGERFGGEGAASRVAYAGALAVGLTTLGGVVLQLKDLRDGKDPRDMTDWKFWSAAFMQGGGAGSFGDFFYAGAGGGNRYGNSLFSAMLGPVASSAEDAIKLTLGNAVEAAQGKDTHAGAEALNFGRSHAPFVNLWYVRTVLDRAFLNDVQEYLSPGYLDRVKDRARSEWGQEFWAPPGGALEDMRGPDLGRAFGE